MELLSMYISSQGPLRGRCFSFDPRYKLEKEGQAFSIKFSNDDEAGSEFWLTPYPKDEPHGTVESVNLIIGKNGSGKTSLVFLLSSMITQIATGKDGGDRSFSGFSVWLEDNRNKGMERYLYVFYTEKEPKISIDQENFTIRKEHFSNSNIVLRDGVAARLIMISSSLENRYFSKLEDEKFKNLETAPIHLFEFTPQRQMQKGFRAEKYLPLDSAFCEQQIEMEKEYNQFCQEKQLTRDTSVEAYFALQLVYLMDACFKGLDRRLDRAQSAVKSKSNDLDLLGTVKLSLNCGTTDREEVNQEFKAKVGFFKSQSLFSKIDWKSISEIFSQISNNSWKEMSFRQYQLVCICLQLLICIQMFIDVEGFLLSNSEDDPIVLLIKTLGQVFKNLETIEKESLYEQTEDEIKRRVNEAIEAPQLGYDEYDDITAMTAKIQLRKTMEKVFAYLSIQVVFQDNKSEDDRNEWVFLRQFTDIMEKERLKNTSISSTKQSLERYLAYSLCPKDENTIWLMPELRLEGSRGQLNMLMLAADLSWIFDGKNSITQNCPNLLLIDEADLAYHPEWQRTFLFWLLSLLHGFDSTVWHVMIATHSPILISDFPRSNIIRLNNEITDNQTDRLNTFAQNIYAIYQSEMHLNTAVGEFARQYMQQIINTINEMETKGCDTSKTYEKVERMIKRIGDPMLKKAYLTRLDKARAKNITDVLIKEMKEKGFEEDKMDYLKRLVESRQ